MKTAWSENIGTTSELWDGETIRPERIDQIAKSYKSWKDLIKPLSSKLPLDSKPIDFIHELVRHQSTAYEPGGYFHHGPGPQSDALPSTPLDASLCQIAEALKNKKISSLELTGQAIKRLQNTQIKTNACVAIYPEQALDSAKFRDEHAGADQQRQLLHGIPLAHKDLLYRKNVHVSCGIKPRELRPYTFSGDARVLEKMQAHGHVDIARLHMTEFAFDPSGLNTEFGACHNPWALNRVPGGSSSGSAAAVATRAIFAAIGSDTGGSIRIPAALCGLTGLKPTWNLVSTHGVMPLSHTNDHLGPIARSAADCAHMMRVLVDEEHTPSSLLKSLTEGFHAVAHGAFTNLKNIRIGIPDSFFFDNLDPDIESVIRGSIKQFHQHGATVIELPGFDWAQINALGAVITRVEAGTRLARLRQIRGLHQEVLERFQEGLALPGTLYMQALNERAYHLDRFMTQVMHQVDCILTPVCRIKPPLIVDLEPGAARAPFYRSELTILNRPINYLGLPALTLPCGFVNTEDDKSLPVGIQLIGKPYADAKLLGLGATWQKMTDFHLSRPDI